jgi:hypothetical protein
VRSLFACLFVLSTTLTFGAQNTDIHVVDSRDDTMTGQPPKPVQINSILYKLLGNYGYVVVTQPPKTGPSRWVKALFLKFNLQSKRIRA